MTAYEAAPGQSARPISAWLAQGAAVAAVGRLHRKGIADHFAPGVGRSVSSMAKAPALLLLVAAYQMILERDMPFHEVRSWIMESFLVDAKSHRIPQIDFIVAKSGALTDEANTRIRDIVAKGGAVKEVRFALSAMTAVIFYEIEAPSGG